MYHILNEFPTSGRSIRDCFMDGESLREYKVYILGECMLSSLNAENGSIDANVLAKYFTEEGKLKKNDFNCFFFNFKFVYLGEPYYMYIEDKSQSKCFDGIRNLTFYLQDSDGRFKSVELTKPGLHRIINIQL